MLRAKSELKVRGDFGGGALLIDLYFKHESESEKRKFLLQDWIGVKTQSWTIQEEMGVWNLRMKASFTGDANMSLSNNKKDKRFQDKDQDTF